ncbi:MAG: hypothetical protein Tsb0020_04430 [Haliangiales bacterium]
MSNLHFIGGEKGGVGKSVVARLVVQRCIDTQAPFAAFDADRSNGVLARHYGDFTKPLDLTQFDSADAIVTAATSGVAQVVVDLPAQSERHLSTWLDDADVLELAAECGVTVLFWHVIDDGKASLITLDRLLDTYGDRAKLVVVKNYGRGRNFDAFDSSPVRQMADQQGATILQLPALHEPVMHKIDHHDVSFWAAANNPSYVPDLFSTIDQQRVKVWLKRAHSEFDKLTGLL